MRGDRRMRSVEEEKEEVAAAVLVEINVSAL